MNKKMKKMNGEKKILSQGVISLILRILAKGHVLPTVRSYQTGFLFLNLEFHYLWFVRLRSKYAGIMSS